jgi:hypothetical protein
MNHGYNKRNLIMTKICTDIPQSKKLIELGLDVKTADMMWEDWRLIDGDWKLSVGYDPEFEQDYGRKCYPAWSLSALLEILPTLDGRNPEFCRDIRYNQWHIFYHGTATLNLIDTKRYENLIDACYEMIIKLKEVKLL